MKILGDNYLDKQRMGDVYFSTMKITNSVDSFFNSGSITVNEVVRNDKNTEGY